MDGWILWNPLQQWPKVCQIKKIMKSLNSYWCNLGPKLPMNLWKTAHNQRSWKDSLLSFTSSPLQYLVIPWCGEVGGPTLVTPAISIGHAGSIRCSTTWGWRFIPLVPDTECMVGRIEPSTVEEFVLFGVVASLGTFFWLMDWWIHWFSKSNWIDLIWGASYHISIYPMPAQPRWSGCL